MLKNVYSVAQVNNYIKNMFETDFMLKSISVKGEVSNLTYHRSGHIYFTIKDESSQISAVMFAGNRRGLDFEMKAGDKIVASGEISVFERDGRYQLYARQIKLDGEGSLYLKYEALKKSLEEMGMFDASYKKPIPKYIRTLGIVTAPTGAAIQDIRNIATRRNPFVQLILYPSLVQGEAAAPSIINGIRALENLGVDLIIVGRGGGSIEDLWAFNEESVARAIFDCSVPIISAVGHETDTTIADYVADLRAPTPSAAAELAVFDVRSTIAELEDIRLRFNRAMNQKCSLKREQLDHMNTRLEFLSPKRRLEEKKRMVLEYESKLMDLMDRVLNDRKNRLAMLANSLNAMSPLKKITGGFAYLSDADEKPVLSANQLKKDDEIRLTLSDGYIDARVTGVRSID